MASSGAFNILDVSDQSLLPDLQELIDSIKPVDVADAGTQTDLILVSTFNLTCIFLPISIFWI